MGFKGGPRTHGQSDRLRAPGSIGAGTDPGRVLKGRKWEEEWVKIKSH
jgi:large subunit ribosomal protein L3